MGCVNHHWRCSASSQPCQLHLAPLAPFSGQTGVAREQLAPPSAFCRLLFVPALSSQTMAGAAGVLPICSRPFLGFPARVQALAGSGSVARDSEHNLPGRSGVALLLCRLAMCFSLEGVAQEKTFPVFGSGWAAPVGAELGLGEGLQRAAPPAPSTSSATSPQHNHTRSYCWCHSFSAKIALKNSLGPSSNRSTAGMC